MIIFGLIITFRPERQFVGFKCLWNNTSSRGQSHLNLWYVRQFTCATLVHISKSQRNYRLCQSCSEANCMFSSVYINWWSQTQSSKHVVIVFCLFTSIYLHLRLYAFEKRCFHPKNTGQSYLKQTGWKQNRSLRKQTDGFNDWCFWPILLF